MRIGSNNSIGIVNQLNFTASSISRSLERLSTGKRVNRPQDDAAAFSTAQNLDAQVRGLRQANVNINRVNGLIKTADAAISVQVNVLQRMRELGVQASNGTLSANERSNLNSELNSLVSEYNRITNDTEFDGTKLLDGSFGTKTFQTGANSGDQLNLDISSLQSSSIFKKTVGSGSFYAVEEFSVTDVDSGEIYSVDLNGDGNQDVVTTPSGSDLVSVKLGNGDGTFQGEQTTSISSLNAATALRDVTGDGQLDLIVGDSSQVNVYQGNGDGTFSESAITSTSTADAQDYDLADVDGDGNLDLIADTDTGGDVTIQLGNGDGTFNKISTVDFGTLSEDLAVGDLDGDGNIDIVSIDSGSTDLSIALGNGDGTFQSITTAALGSGAGDIKVADIDNDGNLDVLAGQGTDEDISILLGNGDGTFASRTTISAGDSPNSFELGDLNNDGNLDLVTSADADDQVYVYFGDGAGSFTIQQTFNGGTPDNTSVSLGDYNNDGVLDVINATDGATLELYLQTSSTESALSDLNVDSTENAEALVSIVDTALDSLIEERSNLGIKLNQLTSRLDSNLLQAENFAEAKANVENLDFAEETAKLLESQILQQAQISALSQSNLQMESVLQLLGGV